MTNPYPRAGPYSNFRRSSYASVAAGIAPAAPSSHSPPRRAGALSHLINQHDLDTSRASERNAAISPNLGSVVNMLSSKSTAERAWPRGGGSEPMFGLGDDSPAPPSDFMCPSYLRNSRYVQRLEVDYKKEMTVMLERRQGRNVFHNNKDDLTPSLSTSSSAVNLHTKASSSHPRAPAHDTTERVRHSEPDEVLNKLPTRWSDTDKCDGLDITGEGLEIRFQGVTKTSDDAATIRSNHPMPKEVGIYYFEVTILSRGKEGLIGIGFSSGKASLHRLPGWEPESWAYHGDDGFSFACTASGKTYGPKFTSWDVIGCGVNFSKGSAFFTKNGVHLGDAFQNIKTDRLLYPSVGMKKPGEHLRANFGDSPFVFDIDSHMEIERNIVKADVHSTSVDVLTSLDERSFIQELIAQYLAHDGYVETARAFADEVHDQRKSLSDKTEPLKMFDPSQDVHAINRQKIRAAILDGDIDKALKYITTYYPHILEKEENRDIYFRLRCRKFIEMMRRCNDMQNSPTPPALTKAFGKLPEKPTQSEDGDVLDHQMELDEQIQRESKPPVVPPVNIPPPLDPNLSYHQPDARNDIMDTAPDPLNPPQPQRKTKSSIMNQTALMAEAIMYGSELQTEFSGDSRPEIMQALTETFALVAYTDARGSIVGGLMETKGRIEIAEEVNGAILVSLGKPSSAALEKLCAQAEVLVDMLSADGGPGAFVNVGRDCLQG